MIRLCAGVALLSGSWLFGLSYYYPASAVPWIVLVGVGTILLARLAPACSPGDSAAKARRLHGLISLVLLLPAVVFLPWPYRAAPLLLVIGLACRLAPMPRRWLSALGSGAVVAGTVMFAQAVTLAGYSYVTARSHELPSPLPEGLAALARLLGADAVADDSAVVIHTMRRVHRLGATWDLLLDPATLCLLVGLLVALGLAFAPQWSAGRRWTAWRGALLAVAAIFVAWLPIRAAALMAVYVHRVLRSDYDLPLHAMNHFFSPWVLLLLLIGPVLLLWRFVRLGDTGEERGARDEGRGAKDGGQGTHEERPTAMWPWAYPAGVGLAALAAALLAAAFACDPIGRPKHGRVMVVERHSNWEPTTRRYDTIWYGEPAGYNYYVMYDYCDRFFEMSRLLETDKIDDEKLSTCDVLMIKTPTARYSRDEVAAVLRFVERGGGLLLVGDHTNYERSGTILNDFARPMGFAYRHDLLFGMTDPYEQLYLPPRVPHPAVQHLPPMNFAVSCSIDPGRSWGRAAIRNTALWSMPPEYHHENFHPIPNHCPDMRYGAFVQLWSARYGKGRALAFTDSTIFSNFCLFQPGKAELMLGMLQWLNHADGFDPGPLLFILGLVCCGGGFSLLLIGVRTGAGLRLAPPGQGRWLLLFAAAVCTWTLASAAVVAAQRATLPAPKPNPDRPMVQVVIDRTVSEAPLSKGPNTQGGGKGFGLLEQWIPRLGYFTSRRSGPAALKGDVLVVLCPDRAVPDDFRQAVAQFVAGGGKLLLIDTAENTKSTANSLLWPFGLSLTTGGSPQIRRSADEMLVLTEQWPWQPVAQARGVEGGRPIAWLGQQPVAAVTDYGQGRVMAVGFGTLLNDISLGETWMLEAEPEVRVRSDVLFALLRLLVEDQPIGRSIPAELPEPKSPLGEPLEQPAQPRAEP